MNMYKPIERTIMNFGTLPSAADREWGFPLNYADSFNPLTSEQLREIQIPVVAFSGPIGCGKTTLAQRFLKYHPNWVVINYADVLREVVELVYGIPAVSQKDAEVKKMTFNTLADKTLRQTLQFLGTEAFREVNPRSWINAFNRRVAQAAANGVEGVFVEDCRFLNEAANLREFNNGYVVYINRPVSQETLAAEVAKHHSLLNRVRRRFGMSCFNLHASELEMFTMPDHADYRLRNDFDLTTTKGANVCDQQLFQMLSHFELETAWHQSKKEDFTW